MVLNYILVGCPWFIYLSIYTQFDFRFLLARCLTLLISVYHCMENQDIPTRIQIERFIPVEIFRKKVIPFKILPFSCFYRNDRNFLYHLFGLPLPCFMSRESEKFTDSKWYNSIPFLFSMPKKKIPVLFDGNFSPKFAYKCKRSIFPWPTLF